MQILFKKLTVFSLLLSMIFAVPTLSEAGERNNVTDSMRSFFDQKGISTEFVYTGEYVSVPSGGVKNTNGLFLDNLDLTLIMDTKEVGLWDRGTFFIYFLANHGANPTEYAGDLQASSNIETTESRRVYELWYEQGFFNQNTSILFGLHDLNSEFNVTDYGGLYLNSSFGIEPDISANVPVSIFSVASPGVRLKLAPYSWLTFLAASYDGDPGDPAVNTSGFDITIDTEKEGLMNIFELDFMWLENVKLQGAFKVGLWHHTGNFDDKLSLDSAGNSVVHSSNTGFYFIADQMLYRENEAQGLAFFWQYGRAPKDRNEVDEYLGFGLNYTGLIPGRDEDTFGIAVARAHISRDLVQAETASGSAKRTEETAIEFTYHAPVNSWFSLQPDMQIINNPGADTSVDTALVYALRFKATF